MPRLPLLDRINTTQDASYDDTPLSPTRLRIFALVIVLLFAVLIARLWFLQVLQGEDLRGLAEINRRRQVRTVAPRGQVEDLKGRVLINNSEQFTVFIDKRGLPKDKDEQEAILNNLAPLLNITRADIDEIIRKNKGGVNDPIPIAEGVDEHTLARVAENQRALPGVELDPQPVRQYPQGKTAAHVLGSIGPVDLKDLKDPEVKKLGYHAGDYIGKGGIEKQYDYLLNGEEGGIWYETDAKNRRLRKLEEQKPVAGATLQLNLDLELQKVAEKALGNRKGAIVALDPRDGGVLAMASWPNFDPNLLARRPLPSKIYKEQVAPGLFNRAWQTEQAPGSTFKIVTAAAGLATNKVDQYTCFTCGGGMSMGKYFKRCHAHHGTVSLIGAMASSCDVYFYQTALAVKAPGLAEWGDKFGLGQKTDLDLPWESTGYMPNPERHARRAAARGNKDTTWYPGFTANAAIGQGDVLVTPLQMALVVSAIANGGTIYAPRVVRRAISVGDDKKVIYEMKPKIMHRLGLSDSEISLIARSLRAVVESGTSKAAALPGIAVAGKSGSAEKKGRRGMGEHATDAWFVAYAPFEKPTIAICVYLESEGQNYHGGADAAPVARKVMAAHFGVADPGTAGKVTPD